MDSSTKSFGKVHLKIDGCLLFYFITFFFTVFELNSVELGQILHFAASDLGLHCLHMSLLWDTRHK